MVSKVNKRNTFLTLSAIKKAPAAIYFTAGAQVQRLGFWI